MSSDALPKTEAPEVLPYGRQWLDEADIEAVVEVLRSDWLTTGPMVERFEQAFAAQCGVREAVAVSSGTAALHAAISALDLDPGDEVITTPMTFVATANAVLFAGGVPVFADVDPETLLLDPAAVEAAVTSRTRAILAVDYAGQPCDYDALRDIATRHGLALVADACHSLGGALGGRPVGNLADLSCFSLHPVKPITTGEGGMVTTGDDRLAERIRRFRNHGIDTDQRQRQQRGQWEYEMRSLGYNYRLTDFQCALGLSQLTRLEAFTGRRAAIAQQYDRALTGLGSVEPLRLRAGVRSAHHLYVIRVQGDRRRWFGRLREAGIGVNVHYRPVYLHAYYVERFGDRSGLCPVAETAYEQMLSLPIFPRMSDSDVRRVIDEVRAVAEAVA